MGRNACTKSGNDEVYTPIALCEAIVKHYSPKGSVLEPCAGSGNFVKAFKDYGLNNIISFDITDGNNFLNYEDNHDWLITNPPFSLLHKFARKGMSLQIPNIVFLSKHRKTPQLRDVVP